MFQADIRSHTGIKALPQSPNDGRPEFRIAYFGLGPKFQRLMEIVIKHAKNNPYRFVLADSREHGSFDLALVDMTTAGGAEVAKTLDRVLHGRGIVKVGRRFEDNRPKDDLVFARFTAGLVATLNQFVERYFKVSPLQAHSRPIIPGLTIFEDGEIRRPRALVVDDSPTVRKQMSIALNQLGVEAETVSSAFEALDTLAMRHYEIVFADVMMPEMDGYRLVKEIKRDRDLRGLPVVMLTSKSSPFDLVRGALAGTNSYLVKPTTMGTLRSVTFRHLKKVLAKRQEGGFSGVLAGA
jgi:CheY-like chemotaxis protein